MSQETTKVLTKAKYLSPFCHPCHPLKMVQTPCISAFCHPATLKEEKYYYIMIEKNLLLACTLFSFGFQIICRIVCTIRLFFVTLPRTYHVRTLLFALIALGDRAMTMKRETFIRRNDGISNKKQ